MMLVQKLFPSFPGFAKQILGESMDCLRIFCKENSKAIYKIWIVMDSPRIFAGKNSGNDGGDGVLKQTLSKEIFRWHVVTR